MERKIQFKKIKAIILLFVIIHLFSCNRQLLNNSLPASNEFSNHQILNSRLDQLSYNKWKASVLDRMNTLQNDSLLLGKQFRLYMPITLQMMDSIIFNKLFFKIKSVWNKNDSCSLYIILDHSSGDSKVEGLKIILIQNNSCYEAIYRNQVGSEYYSFKRNCNLFKIDPRKLNNGVSNEENCVFLTSIVNGSLSTNYLFVRNSNDSSLIYTTNICTEDW